MLAALSDETQWFLILHSDDIALENFIQRNVEILERCGLKSPPYQAIITSLGTVKNVWLMLPQRTGLYFEPIARPILCTRH